MPNLIFLKKNKIMTNVENTIDRIQTIKQLLNDVNFEKYMKNQDDNILLDTMRLRMQILINKLPNKMEYLEHNDENIYCHGCNGDENIILIDDDLDILTSNTIEKKPKKVYTIKKCPHGKRKSRCIECGGSSICVHKKEKSQCKDCLGSSFCEHKKLKQYCTDCGGASMCIHDKRRSRCITCGGSDFCEHGREKSTCKTCGGSSICIHNKRKQYCAECDGSSTCIHKKQKTNCVECNGSNICIHKKNKQYCVDCNGSQICVHKKEKRYCIECDGCGICIHNKTKRYCVDCNGSGICIHKKRKEYCKTCGGSALCKSSWCETSVTKKYEGYCLFCYVNKFPDKPISRNYKTKELNVGDHVTDCYPDLTWICDKRIQDGCSKRKPDMLVDLGTHIIIVEVDENAHKYYDCSCENKRIMEISEDVGGRPIVFIRFNPDKYVDFTGKKIKSCWKINKTSGILHIDTTKETEWKERIDVLNKQIQYWIDNPSDKTIEIVELFYGQNIEENDLVETDASESIDEEDNLIKTEKKPTKKITKLINVKDNSVETEKKPRKKIIK
jgi:hypothetical protein